MERTMKDLHAAIMNLPCKYDAAWQTPAPSDWVEGYVNGHRDTRHAAAELAAAHDAGRQELVELLRLAEKEVGFRMGNSLIRRIHMAIAKATGEQQ
jgi:hypothetical protein